MEQALIVMAIAMSVQTLFLVGAALGAFLAWRKAVRALDETKVAMNAQIAHLRAHVDRISDTVEEVGSSVRRGTEAVGEVVADVRDAVGTVGHSLQNVAAVVAAPRTAVAIGVLRGVAMWRRRRGSQHQRPALVVESNRSESQKESR